MPTHTLGDYRDISAALFGPASPATEFLNKKIAEQGEAEPVLVDESQMLLLLATLHEGRKK